MDWTKKYFGGSQETPQGAEAGGSGRSAPALGRSLSFGERTRLGLSQTWYSLVETLGLQKISAVLSGVYTLPTSTDPLYLLGKRYEPIRPPAEEEEVGKDGGEGRAGAVGASASSELDERTELLAADMASRAWVTYRSGFHPMGPSGLTTDAGWGCTIRSGQMLLCNCLLVHLKGREWRRGDAEADSAEVLREVVSLFFDSPQLRHYFSIHNIVKQGRSFGIVAGHWVGPYVLCQALHKIIKMTSKMVHMNVGDQCPIALYLVAEPHGGIPTLYRSRGAEIAGAAAATPSAAVLGSHEEEEGKEEEGTEEGEEEGQGRAEAEGNGPWKPLLILIPVTLGVTPKINVCYVPQILATLSMPQSVGIIGGKPGKSLYIMGSVGENVLVLDPHTLKPFHGDYASEEELAESYFCKGFSTMLCRDLDPSLALGFFCRTRADYADLYDRLDALQREHPTTAMVSLAAEPTPEGQAASADLQEFTDSKVEVEGWVM